MIEPKRFLMRYCIGARGDFLCNLLCDRKSNINGTFYSLPPVNGRTVKVHSMKDGAVSTIDSFPEAITNYDDMFRLADEHNLIKIKIIATTEEERLDVAYFGWLKSLYYGIDRTRPHITVDKRDIENHTEEIRKSASYLVNTALYCTPKIQNEDRGYEDKYNYIVNFDDLFKMDYLNYIYEQVNKKPIPLSYIPRIKANLAIQNRLSESVNYPYFKEILLRHHNIHEEHLAISNLIQQLI